MFFFLLGLWAAERWSCLLYRELSFEKVGHPWLSILRDNVSEIKVSSTNDLNRLVNLSSEFSH